jgi:hypothetical protein
LDLKKVRLLLVRFAVRRFGEHQGMKEGQKAKNIFVINLARHNGGINFIQEKDIHCGTAAFFYIEKFF